MQGDEVERSRGPSTQVRIETTQMPVESGGRGRGDEPNLAAFTDRDEVASSFRALWRPLAVVVFSICVTVLCGGRDQWELASGAEPVIMLGLALGCFLALRIHSGLAPYREASVQWSHLLTEARTLHRQALVQVADRAQALDLARMQVRLADAVRLELAAPPRMMVHTPIELGTDATSRVCSPDTAQSLLESMAAWITERQTADGLTHYSASSMGQTLRRMGLAFDACVRIAARPRSKRQLVAYHLTSLLFCFALPFGLVEDLGVFTPGISTLVAYGFFCLEDLAKLLESPFRGSGGLGLKAACDELATFYGEGVLGRR